MITVRPGKVGGAESYVRGLLRAFPQTSDPSIDVTVLANRAGADAYAEFAAPGVAIRRVPGAEAPDAVPGRVLAFGSAVLAPRRLTGHFPASLDLVHYPVAVPVPRTKLPTVVTLHDVQHRELPHLFSRAARAYRAVFYDAAARHATLVITVSEHARSAIVEHLGVPPERVVAIHHGIDHDRFHPGDDHDERLLTGLPLPPRPFLYYPANLWPHKNHETLLRAFATAREGLPDLSLVLTGATYDRLAALETHARSLGIADHVHHLGFVPADAVPALYRAAAALVFPSLYEGFGAPPLEAMACGCPVVSSNRGSLAEVCGDAAALCDPTDVAALAAEITRVVTDGALRESSRRAGIARSREFNWQDAARRHRDAYGLALAATTR